MESTLCPSCGSSGLVQERSLGYTGPLCILCGWTEDNAIRRRQMGQPDQWVPVVHQNRLSVNGIRL